MYTLNPDSDNQPNKEKIKKLEAKIKELELSISNNSNCHYFFSESLDLFCIANKEGYFKLINPAFSTLLGYSNEELLNRPFISFIHPDDVQKTIEEIDFNYKSGKLKFTFENRFLSKSGNLINLEWSSTIDENDGTIFAIARDITSRKKNEAMLLQREELLNKAQSISKTGSWSLEFKTQKIYWSKEMYTIYQIDPSLEGIDLNNAFMANFSTEERERLNILVEDALKNGKSYSSESFHKFSDGTEKWILETGIPIMNGNNEYYKIEGTAQDITESKLITLKTLYNESLLKVAQKMSKLGSWSYDFKTNESYWSDELYNILEFPNEPNSDLFENYLSRFNTEDLDRFNNLYSRLVSHSESYSIEYIITLPDEREKWIFGYANPIVNESGEIIKIEGFAQDITDHKKYQQTMLNNVKEKEILLKELHHRVKNNMQVISSMLSLQSNIIDNPIVNKVFQDSQLRIESMAIVHDLLYQSKNLSDIRFSDYINTLVLDLVNSYKGIENNITIDIQVPEIEFNIQKAIPLGLFINEIITNSLKYAFFEQTNGKISISLEQDILKKNIMLKISDNGIGFDEIKEISKDTLGLILIENLANQLDGKLERITSSEGTTYILNI